MRMIDGDALEREGWSLYRNYQQDKNTMVYETKSIVEIPTAQPEHLPYRDFENRVEPSAELKRFARWVNCKEIFKASKNFAEYNTAIRGKGARA